MTVRRWTNNEKAIFTTAYDIFGDNWARVQEYIGTRNLKSVQTYGLNFIAANSKEQPMKIISTQPK